jgi:hypothetical protein
MYIDTYSVHRLKPARPHSPFSWLDSLRAINVDNTFTLGAVSYARPPGVATDTEAS